MNDMMVSGDVRPIFVPHEVGTLAPRIRRATEDDIPYMLAMAREKYPDRPVEQGIPWMQWCLKNPDRLVLIGQDSIGMAEVGWYYGYSFRPRLSWLVGRPVKGAALETLTMLRMMLVWAKEKGCTEPFRLSAETNIDFEPYSRRLGGRAVTSTTYLIPL